MKKQHINPNHIPLNDSTQFSEESHQRTCTLYVCTSCRMSGTPREPIEKRQGHKLFVQLQKALQSSPLSSRVKVEQAACLSVCPRPCGLAFTSGNCWSYLFGDQYSEENVDDILECISMYLQAKNGYMERHSRPKTMRSSILGRIPPMEK